MLRNEVNSCRQKAHLTPYEEREAFVNALIKLLQININSKEREAKTDAFIEYVFSDCLSEIKQFKLGEIHSAYKMALNGTLLYKNEPIDVYPELSNITFSKIIQALKIYKQENQEYLNAKAKLLALQAPDQLEAERKENLAQQLDFWQRAYDFCMEVGYHENMHRIYFKLEAEKKLKVDPIDKKNKYAEVLKDYESELNVRKSILTENKDNLQVRTVTKEIENLKEKALKAQNEAVINRCKAFFVSQWLIESKTDFRSFYKMIYLSEIKDAKEFQTRLSEIYKGCVINQDGTVSKNALKIGKIVTNNGKYTFIENEK